MHAETMNPDERLDAAEERIEKLYEWRARWQGGLTVALWFFGIAQGLIVILCGWVLTELNGAKSDRSTMTTDIAVVKQKMETLSNAGAFSADRNTASEAALEMRVRGWAEARLDLIGDAVKCIEKRVAEVEKKQP